MNTLRLASDFLPVLKPCIVIDVDNTAVHRIATFLLGARYPVPRSGLFLDAVVFVAGLRFQKTLVGVRIRARRARHLHPANAARAGQTTCFVLDVHDALHAPTLYSKCLTLAVSGPQRRTLL